MTHVPITLRLSFSSRPALRVAAWRRFVCEQPAHAQSHLRVRVERLRIPHFDRLHAALRALRADYTLRNSREIRIDPFAN
jgi:hypothetical protein